MDTPNTINILGNPYRAVPESEMTLRHQLAQQRSLKAVGTFEQKENETEDQLFERVFEALVETGIYADLLAVHLLPVGSSWSKDVQEKTAAAIDLVTDPEEKKAIVKFIGWVIAAFFAQGTLLRRASQLYSSVGGQGVPGTEATMTIPLACGALWPARFLVSILSAWKVFLTVLRSKSAPATSNS